MGNPARVAEGRGSPGAFFMRVLSPFHDLVTSMLSLYVGSEAPAGGFCHPRGTRGHHVALTAHTLLLWGGRPEESLGHTTATFDASSLSSPPGSAPDETRWEVGRLV